tara:strand:+ start:1888 stop:2277 length:390 start_codon:yes stop_codon:yes gene_type:complete
MTPEVLSLLGGGFAGFIFRLIGSLVEAQQANVEAMIKKQEAADNSADRAQARGGVWVRRGIVATILFAVVIAPFILSFFSTGVTVGNETGLFGINFTNWKTLDGFVILPEVKQTLIALVGYYFGSSQIK